MKITTDSDSKQQFYLGKIYFLLFGIASIFFALKPHGIYNFVAIIFGIFSLLLALRFKIFIKNKIIIYSFLCIAIITNLIFTVIYNLPFNSIFSWIWFLVPGFIIIYKINAIPEEEFNKKKVSKKSLLPFFLITIAVTFVILSFLLYLNFSN